MVNIFFPFRGVITSITSLPGLFSCQTRASLTISFATSIGVPNPVTSIKSYNPV